MHSLQFVRSLCLLHFLERTKSALPSILPPSTLPLGRPHSKVTRRTTFSENKFKKKKTKKLVRQFVISKCICQFKIRTRATKIINETVSQEICSSGPYLIWNTFTVYSACERSRFCGCLVLLNLQLSLNRFCTKQVYVQQKWIRTLRLRVSFVNRKSQTSTSSLQFGVRRMYIVRLRVTYFTYASWLTLRKTRWRLQGGWYRGSCC